MSLPFSYVLHRINQTTFRARSYVIAPEERVLVSDDFENELNLYLLMGTDVVDPRQRGVIQFFDNETAAHVRTMRFDRGLDEVSVARTRPKFST